MLCILFNNYIVSNFFLAYISPHNTYIIPIILLLSNISYLVGT